MIKNPLKYLFVIIVFSLSIASPAPVCAQGADLAGEYTVAGWDPGRDAGDLPDYKGWVELKPWGDAWKYRGFMDGHSYVGVGLYDAATATLSLSFSSEDGAETGLTVLVASGDGFLGRWVFSGVGEGIPGREKWTRKP